MPTGKQPPTRRLPREPKRPRPRIEGYTDYRTFLADMYKWLKDGDPRVSYRSLAEACGLRSPGFLHLVVHGKRNLGDLQGTIQAVAQGLGLNKRESKVFQELVALSQATTSDDRQKKLHKLVRKQSIQKSLNLRPEFLNYLESWQAVAVRELAGRRDFEADPAWIARQFRIRLTKQQAAEALRLLLSLGMLRETEDGGVEQVESQISTPDELRQDVIRHYHIQMGRLAEKALEVLTAEERTFGAVTGRVKEEDLPKVREYLHKMRNEFHAYISQFETPDAEVVIQTNFQMFPLTRQDKEPSE